MSAMEEDDVLEVSLGEILYQLIHKFWIIILTGVVCAISAFIAMEILNIPVYLSSTSILLDVQDVQLSDEYVALAYSNEVLDKVLEELELDYSVEDLRSKITASVQPNTRILNITVNDKNPEMSKTLADTLRKHLIDLIRSSRGINNIRVLNEGNLPKYSSGLSTKKVVAFTGAVGAFFAACVIVMMAFLRSTICTSEEVRKYIHLDTLGMIPSRADKKSRKNTDEEPAYILEAYNALRTNLLFCSEDIRSVAFVSCKDGDGTTDIVWRLSLSLADVGKKVLVVDANMRKKGITDFVPAEQNEKGLFCYLSGHCDLKDCVLSSSNERLYRLPSGEICDNPAELLSNGRFGILMAESRELFDYILVDCPPLSDAIDGAILAKACDASIIVLEAGRTERSFVQDVKNQLEKAGSDIIGVILNKFNAEKYNCYGNYLHKSFGKISRN